MGCTVYKLECLFVEVVLPYLELELTSQFSGHLMDSTHFEVELCDSQIQVIPFLFVQYPLDRSHCPFCFPVALGEVMKDSDSV